MEPSRFSQPAPPAAAAVDKELEAGENRPKAPALSRNFRARGRAAKILPRDSHAFPLARTNQGKFQMPVLLDQITDLEELSHFDSVLIVPCRFCPAASLALKTGRPYFEVWPRLMKTAAYEEYVLDLKNDLRSRGVRAEVFRSRIIHQFVICMWTEQRRRKLARRAMNYQAVVVLGCEAAMQTIHDAIKDTPCRLFQGMRNQGIMSIKPRLSFPLDISLKLDSLTPYLRPHPENDPWIHL